MAKTLLQKALDAQDKSYKKDATDEEVELALAWVQGLISINQIRQATGQNHNTAVNRMAYALKEAYREGVLKLVK